MSFFVRANMQQHLRFDLERENHEDAIEKLNALKRSSATGTIATRSDMQCFILSFRIGKTAKLGLNLAVQSRFKKPRVFSLKKTV